MCIKVLYNIIYNKKSGGSGEYLNPKHSQVIKKKKIRAVALSVARLRLAWFCACV